MRPLSTVVHFSNSMVIKDGATIHVNGQLGDRHLTLLKKKWNKAGLTMELKRRAFYIGPSEARRLKNRKAEIRRRKKRR